MLRQHGETHGLADFHAPGIERLQPLDDAQKRRLADAVGAHDAVAIAGADDPVDIVQDDAVPEAQRCAFQIDHLLAEARHGHALELQLVAQGRHVGNERLGGGHVELGLGGVAVLTGEGLFLLPPALPLLFDGCEIVLQINHTFLYFCAGVNPPAGIRINSVILYPKISMIARAAPPFFRVRLPEEMIKKFSSLFQKILIFSLLPLRIHPVS